jgi:hypothetical protein
VASLEEASSALDVVVGRALPVQQFVEAAKLLVAAALFILTGHEAEQGQQRKEDEGFHCCRRSEIKSFFYNFFF